VTGAGSVRDAIAAATDALAAAGCDTPQLDAEVLIADTLGVDRGQLVTGSMSEVPVASARAIGERVRRRVVREPVAYILGRKGFRHIDLAVDPRVLIPRPETELLVEVALSAPRGASVHDVGQVIATSSAVGGIAVSTAIVVKLTRVLLLGPLLAWIAWSQRRPGLPRRQLAPPLFVLGFLGAALLRSADAVPDGLLEAIADAKVILLAVALFAVGARVEVRRLLAVGARPLLLGFASWAIVAAVAYAGVRAVWA